MHNVIVLRFEASLGPDISFDGFVILGEDKMTDEKIHEVDMAWLQESMGEWNSSLKNRLHFNCVPRLVLPNFISLCLVV